MIFIQTSGSVDEITLHAKVQSMGGSHLNLILYLHIFTIIYYEYNFK